MYIYAEKIKPETLYPKPSERKTRERERERAGERPKHLEPTPPAAWAGWECPLLYFWWCLHISAVLGLPKL